MVSVSRPKFEVSCLGLEGQVSVSRGHVSGLVLGLVGPGLVNISAIDLGEYLYTDNFIEKSSVSSKFFCCMCGMSTWLLNVYCIAYYIVLV